MHRGSEGIMDGSGIRDDHPAVFEERRPLVPFVVRLQWAPGRIAVITAAGEVDYYTSTCLRDLVELALEAGAAGMLFDLSEVTFLDASGLGVAVLAARALGASRTAVVCPDPHLVRIFRVTALDRALTICERRAEAMAGLTPEPLESMPPVISLDGAAPRPCPRPGSDPLPTPWSPTVTGATLVCRPPRP